MSTSEKCLKCDGTPLKTGECKPWACTTVFSTPVILADTCIANGYEINRLKKQIAEARKLLEDYPETWVRANSDIAKWLKRLEVILYPERFVHLSQKESAP